MTVDVYQYQDVKRYLADVYAWKKAHTKSFSYRAFSRKIGVKSPNHLKRVIDGERNLPDDMAKLYAKALKLRGEAATYFLHLARLGRAKTNAEREAAFQAMLHSKRYRAAHAGDVQFSKYCSHWYLPAVRELAGCPAFQRDPHWVAQQLDPPITPAAAADALHTLTELGLLKEQDGQLVRSDAMVTTGAETKGVHIRRYHASMLERAADSMEISPPAERDISSVTLCVRDDLLPELKAEIQAFRRRLMELAESAPDPDRVVQFNVQLFPLTRNCS